MICSEFTFLEVQLFSRGIAAVFRDGLAGSEGEQPVGDGPAVAVLRGKRGSDAPLRQPDQLRTFQGAGQQLELRSCFLLEQGRQLLLRHSRQLGPEEEVEVR